jgi:hypothetical protein
MLSGVGGPILPLVENAPWQKLGLLLDGCGRGSWWWPLLPGTLSRLASA